MQMSASIVHSLHISVIFCEGKTDDGRLAEVEDLKKLKKLSINIFIKAKGLIASQGAIPRKEEENIYEASFILFH